MYVWDSLVSNSQLFALMEPSEQASPAAKRGVFLFAAPSPPFTVVYIYKSSSWIFSRFPKGVISTNSPLQTKYGIVLTRCKKHVHTVPMTAIHQCDPPLYVNTPLGEGHCLFLIDYGISINSVWVVHLFESSKIVHVDSSEIRVFGNPMYSIPDPEKPQRSMHR
jgi:hypothetical protein